MRAGRELTFYAYARISLGPAANENAGFEQYPVVDTMETRSRASPLRLLTLLLGNNSLLIQFVSF